ncbi:hypothetical protein [Staphylococcus aureus]|jgi:hypothetical protein|uniref:hypothetical protein n=1 Tax=Staphylococcus aureus TaxID=1280 RepID=UPI0012E5F61E|nr:hypothetical protein [Staphylococcus aureus]GFD66729.1 hypothetical protein ksw1_27060 [Staphylococcus aureus]
MKAIILSAIVAVVILIAAFFLKLNLVTVAIGLIAGGGLGTLLILVVRWLQKGQSSPS